MKKALLISLFLFFLVGGNYQKVNAHGGEDHGAAKAPSGGVKTYFSSQAVSEKYEMILKFEPLEVGETGKLRLYINDFITNRPIENATLKISSPEDANIKFETKPNEKGVYEISGMFPAKKKYSLTVSINAESGPDLFSLQNIEIGKELPQASAETEGIKTTHWYEKPYFLVGAGLLIGMLLMFLLSKIRNKKAVIASIILICLLPTAHWQKALAHGDEGAGSSTGALSNAFEVPKETQFLFEVLTQKIGNGEFTESQKLFGTVMPSQNGQALVQTPQTGKIVSLNARVGQKVSKGQTLAVIEQNIDASTQVSFQAERNNLEAELQAAKREYDRLKGIEDIAAKKDVSEAEARYQKAQQNLKVFKNVGSDGNGSLKWIALKSPISGTIGNFNFSLGSTVNSGETIFTVINLSKVYIEVQVYDKDVTLVNGAKKFTAEYSDDSHKTAQLKLIAPALTVNPTNQSQRVLFELDNPTGGFKIGEFVNIRVFAGQPVRGITIPSSAISEINGKPVVFMKDSPEGFSVAYVSTGNDNGEYTIIKKGIEEGERVVVNGTYQLKMIYQNQ